MAKQGEAAAAIPWEIRGRGYVERAGVQAEVTYHLSRDKYTYSAAWQLHAVAVSVSHLHAVLAAGNLDQPLSLIGSNGPRGHRLRIDNIPWPRGEGEILTSEIWRFHLEDGDLDGIPAEWHVAATLTPTPFSPREAQMIRDTRGLHELHEQTPPVQWNSHLGPVEFSDRLVFETVTAGAVTGNLEISYPSVRIGHRNQTEATAADFLRDVEEYLGLLLRFLGLLGRNRTMWTKIVAFPADHQVHGWYRAKQYQIVGERSTSRRGQPLVAPHKFTDLVNDGMLQRFVDHQYRSEIISCIDILHTSREKTVSFGLHKFISAFTAFEAVTSAYASATGLGDRLQPAQRRRLLAALRSSIDAFAADNGLPSEYGAALKSRAAEVTRAGFIERALWTLQAAGISTTDLFPPGTDLPTELRRVAKLRNELVHLGRDVPIYRSYPAGARLNLLTERILYSWLGGKPEWVSQTEDYENRWLTEERTLR